MDTLPKEVLDFINKQKEEKKTYTDLNAYNPRITEIVFVALVVGFVVLGLVG